MSVRVLRVVPSTPPTRAARRILEACRVSIRLTEDAADAAIVPPEPPGAWVVVQHARTREGTGGTAEFADLLIVSPGAGAAPADAAIMAYETAMRLARRRVVCASADPVFAEALRRAAGDYPMAVIDELPPAELLARLKSDPGELDEVAADASTAREAGALAAALVGGADLVGVARYAGAEARFEAGSPAGAALAVSLALDHLHEGVHADRVDRALTRALRAGARRDDADDLAAAVISELGRA